jgi:hypothetical protein
MRRPSTTAVSYWFDYLPSSGQLVWKRDASIGVRRGDVAGSIDRDRYHVIGWQGVSYQASTLIWIWHGNKIDSTLRLVHKNGDTLDNRIENLHQIPRKNHSTGERYICHTPDNKRRPYRVRIRNRSIGQFYTLEEAKAAVDSYLTNNA